MLQSSIKENPATVWRIVRGGEKILMNGRGLRILTKKEMKKKEGFE